MTDLNYGALVDAVAAESGVDKPTVRRVLRATLDVIGRTVATGYRVNITNFGAWSRKVISNTRNPQTGGSAGPTATASFRPTGRLSEWVRTGWPVQNTLKKDRSDV
jgi:nucleoid DNA-binding protein